MALVFSLSHLSYVSLCSFSDELDHYNFVLRSSLLYRHSHGGPLCLTVACSMQLLKALSPAAQGDTYPEFSSHPIPSGLCIDIVPLILHVEVPSWMCLPMIHFSLPPQGVICVPYDSPLLYSGRVVYYGWGKCTIQLVYCSTLRDRCLLYYLPA